MPNVSQFGTQTDNATVQGTVTDRAMVIPDIPPQGLMSVGPRVTPHFVKPSLWSALTTYHFFDAVHDAAGASYVAIKPEVPAGTELTDEGYWFLWADPNSQFADLSELVKTYDARITQNTEDIASAETRLSMYSDNDVHMAIFSDSTFQTNGDPNAPGRTVKSVVDWLKDFTDAIITNYGVGGTDTQWLLNRIDQIPASELFAFDVIIIAYGTNDWQGSVNPIQIVSNATDSLEYLYNAVLQKLQQKAPKANIICVTPGYIHSAQSSDDPKTLNYNRTGNSFKTYCDVIEHVANKNGCGVLRLDELLSIGENNYSTQMVTSNDDIWVHYNETTTKKIAKMIAANLFKPVNGNTPGKCIDVTPKSILNMCKLTPYYGFGDLYGFASAQDVTFILNTMPNVNYNITFIGGSCEIVVDNNVISRSSKQSITSVSFTATKETTTVTLKYVPSIGQMSVFQPRVTVNRPNIYDALSSNNARTSGSSIINNFAIYYENNYSASNIKMTQEPDSQITVTSLTESVLTLPNDLKGSYTGFGYGIKDSQIEKIFARSDIDGQVYLDCASGEYKNINVILTGLVGL